MIIAGTPQEPKTPIQHSLWFKIIAAFLALVVCPILVYVATHEYSSRRAENSEEQYKQSQKLEQKNKIEEAQN